MNPLYRSTRRLNSGNDTPLVIAFIVIFLLAAFVFGIDRISGGAVRGYARQGGGAIRTAASAAAGTVTGSGLLNSKRSLIAENEQLREAIAIRDEQAARFDALQEENSALRALLGLADEEGVTVPVLSSFSSSP